MSKGCIVWFTGLPCSGKSTIAKNLYEQILLDGSRHVVRLDGDTFRKEFCKDLGFSKEDREENLRRVCSIARQYEKQGFLVICSFVSPLISMRKSIKKNFNRFIEVFVDADLEICIQRDVKGMYAKAFTGEIKEFTGLTSPYEKPKKPEIHCITHQESLTRSIDNSI